MVIKFISACICIITLSSCSTILFTEFGLTQKRNVNCAPGFTVTRVYSGVSYSIMEIQDESSKAIKPLLILDLPFSFVMDTICLPVSMVAQGVAGNICEPIDIPDDD